MKVGDLAAVRVKPARERARKLLAGAQLGSDPQAAVQAQRRAEKVGDLVMEYLAHAKARLKPRTYEEVRRTMEKTAAQLHPLKAVNVTRRDITELLERIAASSGTTAANRARAYLSAFWTWLIKTGRIETANPVATTARPGPEKSRERVLASEEIARLWRCTAGGHDHDRIVRLLLLTAARREEVAAMAWNELSLGGDADLWTLPSSRSKNALPHEVTLTALAVEQLPPARKDNPMVFGRSDTGFSGWSKCKARLDERLLLDDVKTRPEAATNQEISRWTLHDLRRTFATWANESGHEPHVVEAVLNHISGSARRGVAGVYNRSRYSVQKRALLKAWEAHLREVCSLPKLPDNVISADGARRARAVTPKS